MFEYILNIYFKIQIQLNLKNKKFQKELENFRKKGGSRCIF